MSSPDRGAFGLLLSETIDLNGPIVEKSKIDRSLAGKIGKWCLFYDSKLGKSSVFLSPHGKSKH